MTDAFEPVTANGWSDPSTDAAELARLANDAQTEAAAGREIIAERDATILSLRLKLEELEKGIEHSEADYLKASEAGFANESSRLATEAAGEPSEWDIYTKQMVEIAEYADWEIRDYRRDLAKIQDYAEKGMPMGLIEAACKNALAPFRCGSMSRHYPLPSPPQIMEEGK